MSIPRAAEDAPVAELRITILHIPDCPSLGGVRDEVRSAIEHVGATAAVEEIEGSCPSPSVLVDGVEIDGYPLGTDPACRIDIPTLDEVAAAIRAARTRVALLR